MNSLSACLAMLSRPRERDFSDGLRTLPVGATECAMVEVEASVHVTRHDADDRASASIVGWLVSDACHALMRAPLEQSGRTRLPLGTAEPFVWLQLVDDRGGPVTEEVFLGHGIDRHYRVHARAPLGVMSRAARSAGADRVEAALRGLYARLLIRTYGNERGPRFSTEALVLALLPVGHPVGLRMPRPAAIGASGRIASVTSM